MDHRELDGSAALDDPRTIIEPGSVPPDRESGEITKKIDTADSKGPEGNGANGHETVIQVEQEIQRLRMEIREQLYIFTEHGGGNRLIDHDRIWHQAMEDMNRLALSRAHTPEEIEALGEKAKALVIAAWQSKPHIIAKQKIDAVRKLVDTNPLAKDLVLEELQRIDKQYLAAELLGEN